jgi:acetate kinase
MPRRILTLNAGSSSIKFALFSGQDGQPLAELARGQVEGIGAIPHLVASAPGGGELAHRAYAEGEIADHHAATDAILDLIDTEFPGSVVDAVGHRVVHGGAEHAAPLRLQPDTLAELERLIPLAPLHQPHNLEGIRAAQRAFPRAVQVACFDTAFHRRHDWVNDTYALPRSFYDSGVRRYGFHGLSYEYIAEEMAKLFPEHAAGRMIVAHLGNGASLCAMQGGRSIASTMGFTALDGLAMGTRCGQIDPGVILHLLQGRGMSAGEVSDLLYGQSGLKGLSGVSHDMRELEASGRPEAAQAIAYFVARILAEIGAMAALAGGMDALVFCGGIGEHSVHVRAEVVNGLGWLGFVLDPERNGAGARIVSADRSHAPVFVLVTDEEQMIARHTWRILVNIGQA